MAQAHTNYMNKHVEMKDIYIKNLEILKDFQKSNKIYIKYFGKTTVIRWKQLFTFIFDYFDECRKKINSNNPFSFFEYDDVKIDNDYLKSYILSLIIEAQKIWQASLVFYNEKRFDNATNSKEIKPLNIKELKNYILHSKETDFKKSIINQIKSFQGYVNFFKEKNKLEKNKDEDSKKSQNIIYEIEESLKETIEIIEKGFRIPTKYFSDIFSQKNTTVSHNELEKKQIRNQNNQKIKSIKSIIEPKDKISNGIFNPSINKSHGIVETWKEETSLHESDLKPIKVGKNKVVNVKALFLENGKYGNLTIKNGYLSENAKNVYSAYITLIVNGINNHINMSDFLKLCYGVDSKAHATEGQKLNIINGLQELTLSTIVIRRDKGLYFEDIYEHLITGYTEITDKNTGVVIDFNITVNGKDRLPALLQFNKETGLNQIRTKPLKTVIKRNPSNNLLEYLSNYVSDLKRKNSKLSNTIHFETLYEKFSINCGSTGSIRVKKIRFIKRVESILDEMKRKKIINDYAILNCYGKKKKNNESAFSLLIMI